MSFRKRAGPPFNGSTFCAWLLVCLGLDIDYLGGVPVLRGARLGADHDGGAWVRGPVLHGRPGETHNGKPDRGFDPPCLFIFDPIARDSVS